MADLEKIIRAFALKDVGNPRRIETEPGSGQPQTVTFTFTGGNNAQTTSASLSDSKRYYMKKKVKESKR